MTAKPQMPSYRVARRAFFRSVGAGAIGLKTLLRNLEAMAQGMTSPPRFLMTHWPVGTIGYLFAPTGSGTALSGLTLSGILKPFQTAGLLADTIVVNGLNSGDYHGAGGGHESGTPQSSTGARTPGTRANGGETDDAVAGGPSWDQIFLRTVPALKTMGVGYANAICDARVDALETSTQCLSYDYATRTIASNPSGTTVTENVPLLPVLSPLKLFQNLFSGMIPGGGTGSTSEMAKLLKARKSVLDYGMAELARMKTLAPAAEATKIQVHTDAIRKVELALADQINMGTVTPTSCKAPPMPDPALTGKTGSHVDFMAQPTPAATDDSPIHEQIGKTHMGILKAAFVCDLIRVGTFQWSPGTNHVSFKGLFPNAPNGIYMHHPTSHIITNASETKGSLPAAGLHQDVVHFLAAVHTWYNQKTADVLADWKNTTDVYGGNLLANTIVPYVTEVAETTHTYSPMPALILGGSALGMKGGQYINTSNRGLNDFWITIAQAYFKSTNPLASLPATNPDGSKNTFVRSNVTPIAGLWAPP